MRPVSCKSSGSPATIKKTSDTRVYDVFFYLRLKTAARFFAAPEPTVTNLLRQAASFVLFFAAAKRYIIDKEGMGMRLLFGIYVYRHKKSQVIHQILYKKYN